MYKTKSKQVNGEIVVIKGLAMLSQSRPPVMVEYMEQDDDSDSESEDEDEAEPKSPKVHEEHHLKRVAIGVLFAIRLGKATKRKREEEEAKHLSQKEVTP